MSINTVIFDMDGLLIDSEPLWYEAGSELLANYGKRLTHEEYNVTVGLRTKEWIEHWFRYFNLTKADPEEAEKDIIDLVISKVEKKGKILPGVEYIFNYFLKKEFKIGLATSSPMRLADVAIDKMGIRPLLQAINSAEFLPFGKPHPQVYIDCAADLGSNPVECLCFEDSFNGMIAAKAAKMKCAVVPHINELKMEKWGAADMKISSLQNFNDILMQRL